MDGYLEIAFGGASDRSAGSAVAHLALAPGTGPVRASFAVLRAPAPDQAWAVEWVAEMLPRIGEARPDSAPHWYRPFLAAALDYINDVLHSRAVEQGKSGPEVACCVGVVAGDTLYLAGAGPAAAFLLRGDELFMLLGRRASRPRPLETPEAEEAPDVTWDELREEFPRALGVGPGLRIDSFAYGLEAGDRVLVCDEHAARVSGPQGIKEILLDAEAPESACKALGIETMGPDSAQGHGAACLFVGPVASAPEPVRAKPRSEPEQHRPAAGRDRSAMRVLGFSLGGVLLVSAVVALIVGFVVAPRGRPGPAPTRPAPGQPLPAADLCLELGGEPAVILRRGDQELSTLARLALRPERFPAMELIPEPKSPDRAEILAALGYPPAGECLCIMQGTVDLVRRTVTVSSVPTRVRCPAPD